ncbi:hypothetical protein [Sciscionella sediminilitoris]|uniref:hypothetical protein n=1 Tax=Sciscionella sediminilitoris TaxID=1445613 RepID=UPI0004DF4793|nr:hypothetical protein [Sciscionella sp. SE31]
MSEISRPPTAAAARLLGWLWVAAGVISAGFIALLATTTITGQNAVWLLGLPAALLALFGQTRRARTEGAWKTGPAVVFAAVLALTLVFLAVLAWRSVVLAPIGIMAAIPCFLAARTQFRD